MLANSKGPVTGKHDDDDDYDDDDIKNNNNSSISVESLVAGINSNVLL
jgi:hypothetical protein